MKKISLVLMVLLVSSAVVFAQNTGIDSVVSDASSGLFTNALDDAANVGGGFDELDGSYLFAGVANLEKTGDNNNWQMFSNSDYWDASIPGWVEVDDNDAMWMGFYKGGDSPWSLFLGFDGEDASGNLSDDTVYSTTPDTVTSGTTSTVYNWNDQIDETTYTGNRFLNEFNAAVQFLTMLGGMNTGLYFDFYVADNTPQANNFELTQDYFYNPVQGTNVAPAPAADYSFTRTQTALDKDLTIGIGVPVFMETGDMSHEVNIAATIKVEDDSTSDVQTYSGTPQGAMGVTNIDTDETIDKTTTIDFDVDYGLGLPAIAGDHKDNELMISASVGIGVEMPTYSDTLIDQDVNYAGAGAAAVNAEADNDTTEYSYENAVDLDISVGVGHSFFYDLGPAMFAFSPALYLGYASDKESLISEATVVDRDDSVSANGTFTDANDSITTVTVSAENTDAAMGDNDVVTTLSVDFAMPVAVKVSPADWPFSITIGSQPWISFSSEKTETFTSSTTQTVVTVSGDGATTTTNVTNSEPTSESVVTENNIGIYADHNIGLSLPVGEAVSLDVNLGMSTSSGSILDFKDMVIQAIVKLP